jgi:hypothetical protein
MADDQPTLDETGETPYSRLERHRAMFPRVRELIIADLDEIALLEHPNA